MDLLSIAALRFRCRLCGETYSVPLRSILLAHQVMHAGCPVATETECPPVFQSRLATRAALRRLERAWKEMERQASSAGTELVLSVASPAHSAAPKGQRAGGRTRS
jgi:hypothetical protein